uniref:Protein BANP n=1 Tax=Strigamia maritima TaxID=126957 RepID=T1ILJ1_STRMM
MTENGTDESHLGDHHNLSVCVEHLSQDVGENSQDEDIGLKMDVEFEDDDEVDFNLPLKQILISMNQAICHRLDTIEQQLDNLNQYCQHLEQKIEDISANVRDHNLQINSKHSGQASVVGLSPTSTGAATLTQATPFTTTVGPNLIPIRLNTESDFPNGSWLGDELNPEMRVRCEIVSSNLLHINTTCPTPEKMALTLLDHLFPRDVQACSNISGVGKHKKKQLDPLLVFGIRHLVHKFGITEKDWHRIKQNMDSKCRTAFRRKQKGLPMMDSENEASMDHISDGGETTDLDQSEAITLEPSTISVVEEGDLNNVMQGAQVIHTTDGDIQVLHATPEQIARIQQTHQIQILTSNHVITDGQIIQHISEAETHLLNDDDTHEELNEDIE